MPEVSVVATVLNEVEEIDGLVSSLSAQVPPPREIIVVDGGSTDGTWEHLQAARQQSPNLITIQDESCNLKASAGPIARGRNVAIAAAKSEIVACADAGCTYDPEWLARLTAPIVNGNAEYALGGSCIDPRGADGLGPGFGAVPGTEAAGRWNHAVVHRAFDGVSERVMEASRRIS